MSKVTMLRRSAGAVQEVLQGQRERALAAFLPQGFSTASLSSVASSQNVATESSASAGTAAAASVGTSEEGVVGSLKQRFLWRVVKSSLLIAATGAVGGAAYVTYSYDVDSVEQKLSALKSSISKLTFDESNLLDKLRSTVYATTLGAAVSVADFYVETRKNLEDQIRGIAAPSSSKLLPDLLPQERGAFTVVLDLNETLVYSDWKRDRGWRTFKRPGVEAFLEQLAQYYELVVYTDQLNFYVDPILEKLDQKGCIRYRLSRDATQYINGKHLRDLEKLNRDPTHVIYLSGHAKDTTLQPENALPIKPWKLEPDDTVLLDMLPFLEFVARQRPADIRPVLASYDGLDIPTEFRERTKELQRKLAERKQTNRLWRGRQ
ncbi:mitochondrial import inner membrane translocase subunit TIM50 [Physcomitrium patens]|uniref:Mitochondrial import inner membrane translocase subunit TIM50 n=2 Tax=Physcomitrium patens TaxID=3218 RepID=A0A7I4FUX9_PHYPA|nr:mitochondrial import inner membrane translocase subunit TIM50-like [Physcomitrium patens]|eukprot:XP_024382334.1 mitochondrial import inner membrane translocase subunit TIM50-like [Physcomitrella patens]